MGNDTSREIANVFSPVASTAYQDPKKGQPLADLAAYTGNPIQEQAIRDPTKPQNVVNPFRDLTQVFSPVAGLAFEKPDLENGPLAPFTNPGSQNPGWKLDNIKDTNKVNNPEAPGTTVNLPPAPDIAGDGDSGLLMPLLFGAGIIGFALYRRNQQQ